MVGGKIRRFDLLNQMPPPQNYVLKPDKPFHPEIHKIF
jgi:hypothetical protein